MDSTNRRCRIAGGLIPIDVQQGAVAVYWPSPAACAQRLTAAADAVAVRSDRRARRGYGCVLAITRGLRPAAHGLASPARSDQIPERLCKKRCRPLERLDGDRMGALEFNVLNWQREPL